MSFFLRSLGAGLIIIAALVAGREYSAYAERRLSETESFISLLSHIGSRVSQFLTPAAELWRDFEDENLERLGFLPALREGRRLSDAFSECEDRLSLGGEIKRRLTVYFAEFGKNYRDAEVKRTKIFSEEISSHLLREREEIPKNVKVTRALICGGALGAVILLL